MLEVHGMFFLYDAEDDEVWLWEDRAQVWGVLPARPEYLDVVNGKLVFVGIKKKDEGVRECDCDNFVLFNFGCKCGGI